MSLFRKPRKPIQRRVFTTLGDHDDSEDEKMDIDDDVVVVSQSKQKDHKKDKKSDKQKSKSKDSESKSKSLLSFADDEDDAEIFQVKKSSHSKKVMRMLDKERRKKKSKSEYEIQPNTNGNHSNINDKNSSELLSKDASSTTVLASMSSVETRIKNFSENVQTEIHTDDFVLVVKKSEPDVILNGRAALIAGKDDISTEEEDEEQCEKESKHRFNKPNNLKSYLKSGSIPDAAMIHAARKERQKAREQSDFIPLEEPSKEQIKKGSRLAVDENEEGSDGEERVNMNEIMGIKEREERREKFYSVQNDFSEGDSDHELNEWENQQIRKGVTGAQLTSAVQQENLLSRFSIKLGNELLDQNPPSTGTLLEQAYATNMFEKPKKILKLQKGEKKNSGPRPPKEISEALRNRLKELNELNVKHEKEIEQMALDLKTLKLESLDYTQKAPTAAAKYKFYQELRCYITDLIECLDEKLPTIIDIEKRALAIISKQSNSLIERRRQDIRDQAKEAAEASKATVSNLSKKEELERKKRSAEREGRRTRRRCERERNNSSSTHFDGMSSDEEVADQVLSQYKSNLDQIAIEANAIFEDVNEDYFQIDNILSKFEIWRHTDIASYKDAFVSLCLPKIVGALVRLKMVLWNPFEEKNQEFDKTEWYMSCLQFGFKKTETLDILINDPDLKFVPLIVEKIILPKLTEIIQHCWDPLSTTQTLRLIGQIKKIGRSYPLSGQSKFLKSLFTTILDKLKDALENDVFIPIFPKQTHDSKTSFFQRQFCSGLKLFRNILSWQGIIADHHLRELAIGSLLNKYLLPTMRFCNNNDSLCKAQIIVNTIPTAWLQPDSDTIKSLHLLIGCLNNIYEQLDKKNLMHLHTYEKAKSILIKLHSY